MYSLQIIINIFGLKNHKAVYLKDNENIGFSMFGDTLPYSGLESVDKVEGKK
jgi:hypothetical protein